MGLENLYVHHAISEAEALVHFGRSAEIRDKLRQYGFGADREELIGGWLSLDGGEMRTGGTGHNGCQ